MHRKVTDLLQAFADRTKVFVGFFMCLFSAHQNYLNMKLHQLLSVVLCTMTTVSIAQNRTVGTTFLDHGVSDGYTLLAPNFTPNDNTIYLIDNCGEIVNTWPTQEYTGLVAKLLPNGNLLRSYVIDNENFDAGGRGGGVQLWDWNGNKIWDYKYSDSTHCQHHDVTGLPDGSVLLLAWESRDSIDWVNAGRDPNGIDSTKIWTESIVQVMPTGDTTGDIVWKWDMWNHLVQDFDASKDNYGVVSEHPELMNINFLSWGGSDDDWMHGNAVDYNEQYDQIILSARHTHEIYVIDHTTTTQQASEHVGGVQGKGGDILYRWGNPRAYGRGTSNDQKLFAQHNSHWIESGLDGAGNIMIFNNGERPDTNYTSIDVIVPPVDSTGAYSISQGMAFEPFDADWSYSGSPNDQFFSQYIGGGQRLQNGNTVICDGTHGRIFEINPDMEKVWEYVNPVNTGGIASQGDTLDGFFAGTNNWVFRAYKYEPDYSGLPANLTASGTVEQNPLPQNLCELLGVADNDNISSLKVYPNPASDVIQIEGLNSQQANLQFFDMMGRQVRSMPITNGRADISDISAGIYVITVKSDDLTSSFRLVKQ